MIVIPTVEVRHGISIRPAGSSASAAKTSLGSPISVVRDWANVGFRRVQVVDGDALSGTGSNALLVEEVIRDGAAEIDACVGVQSGDDIERLFDAGAARVVLGARALDEPSWLAGVADSYPGLLIVATEVRGRRVASRGWVRSLPHDLMDVVDELADLPLGAFLVRSVSIDGGRAGLELSLLEDVANACSFPVIVSGDISTIADLRALANRELSAVVLGERLYDGTFEPYSLAREFTD